MKCLDLEMAIRQSSLAAWQCQSHNDILRLATPMRYPDGGYIEVYIEDRAGRWWVTDFGEAFRYIENHGIDPTRSTSRKRIIEMARKLAAIQPTDGTVELPVDSPGDVFTAIVRVAQAVGRIADTVVGEAGALGFTFADELDEFLLSNLKGVEIRRSAELTGLNATHDFDFVVHSQRGYNAIEAMSSASPAGAKMQSAYAITKFFDVANLGNSAPGRYAVLDDSNEVWSVSLRKQIGEVAQVIDWEQRNDLVKALSVK